MDFLKKAAGALNNNDNNNNNTDNNNNNNNNNSSGNNNGNNDDGYEVLGKTVNKALHDYQSSGGKLDNNTMASLGTAAVGAWKEHAQEGGNTDYKKIASEVVDGYKRGDSGGAAQSTQQAGRPGDAPQGQNDARPPQNQEQNQEQNQN